jgi:hypothetical protein
VVVFLKWAYSYITYDRGLRLITGYKPEELKPPTPKRVQLHSVKK